MKKKKKLLQLEEESVEDMMDRRKIYIFVVHLII
jgi:hypothetical protein